MKFTAVKPLNSIFFIRITPGFHHKNKVMNGPKRKKKTLNISINLQNGKTRIQRSEANSIEHYH